MKPHTIKQAESPVLRLDLNSKSQDLHKEIESLRFELSSLKKKVLHLEQRNHEMLKNEIQYRNVIKSYQFELKKHLKGQELFNEIPETNSLSIEDYHSELNENVINLHEKVNEIVSNRGEMILAVFNSKLKDINNTLEKEKKEKFEYIEGLADREHALSKELQMLKGSIEVIEAKNSHLEKQNKEFKHLIKVKDLEISELQKRIFEIKEKNLVLPSINSERSAIKLSLSQKNIKMTSLAIETDFVEDDTSKRYQKIISKLQKLLSIEKNNVRAARNAYFRELNNRGEVEETIIKCIDEVKKERKNAKRSAYQLSYNMSVVERLSNSEAILTKLQEFMTHKCETEGSNV